MGKGGLSSCCWGYVIATCGRNFDLANGCCCKESFKFGNAGFEQAVFEASFLGHGFDGLEFFALDDIEVAQNLLALATGHGLNFAGDALGRTCGIGHQLGELVEERILGSLLLRRLDAVASRKLSIAALDGGLHLLPSVCWLFRSVLLLAKPAILG
jgi:hypothetical protein